MKVFVFIVLMCLFSALLLARDLSDAAKKERSRRLASLLVRGGKKAPIYTNRDLEAYKRSESPQSPSPRRESRPAPAMRDLDKERRYWQKEKEKHLRDIARLDARIRRLEWRLADRRARKRPGERLRDDPAEKALEESLKSMVAEKRRVIEQFLERGRKAGAFPGWLR